MQEEGGNRLPASSRELAERAGQGEGCGTGGMAGLAQGHKGVGAGGKTKLGKRRRRTDEREFAGHSKGTLTGGGRRPCTGEQSPRRAHKARAASGRRPRPRYHQSHQHPEAPLLCPVPASPKPIFPRPAALATAGSLPQPTHQTTPARRAQPTVRRRCRRSAGSDARARRQAHSASEA